MSSYTQPGSRLLLVHIVLSIVAVIFFTTTAAFADEAVTSNLEAFIVEVDENGEEVFTPADKVIPGGVIEYRIQYTNNTSDALGKFVVNGNIPEQTEYVANSQTPTQSAQFQAFVEELGWVDVPAFRSVKSEAGTIQKIPIEESEFSSLRWKLTAGLAPETSVRVVYRVKVDQ